MDAAALKLRSNELWKINTEAIHSEVLKGILKEVPLLEASIENFMSTRLRSKLLYLTKRRNEIKRKKIALASASLRYTQTTSKHKRVPKLAFSQTT